MTSRKYFLADLIFNIDFDINFNISTNTIYEYNNLYNDKSNIRIIFTLDEIIKKAKKINNNISIDCVNTIDGNIVSLYDDKGFVAHNINATNNWQDIIVKSSMPQKIPFLGSAGEVIFRTSILFHKGFVIHASAIEVKGKGIIFFRTFRHR